MKNSFMEGMPLGMRMLIHKNLVGSSSSSSFNRRSVVSLKRPASEIPWVEGNLKRVCIIIWFTASKMKDQNILSNHNNKESWWISLSTHAMSREDAIRLLCSFLFQEKEETTRKISELSICIVIIVTFFILFPSVVLQLYTTTHSIFHVLSFIFQNEVQHSSDIQILTHITSWTKPPPSHVHTTIDSCHSQRVQIIHFQMNDPDLKKCLDMDGLVYRKKHNIHIHTQHPRISFTLNPYAYLDQSDSLWKFSGWCTVSSLYTSWIYLFDLIYSAFWHLLHSYSLIKNQRDNFST